MATYEKKPPRFEALQFNGSDASAREIIQTVSTLAPTWQVRYLPSSTEFSIENGQIVEKTMPARLKFFSSLGNESEVTNGSWVVISRDGTLEFVSNATFIELYQPI